MFNIFDKKNIDGLFVVSEAEFWKRLATECTPDSYFDAQGDEHSEIDMRLVDKIEDYLAPKIGEWEENGQWFHKMDFYGDGIRSLSFNWAVFSPIYIHELQTMLTGEHEPFCILCQFHEDLECEDDTKIGSMAIFSKKIMVSKNVANKIVAVA